MSENNLSCKRNLKFDSGSSHTGPVVINTWKLIISYNNIHGKKCFNFFQRCCKDMAFLLAIEIVCAITISVIKFSNFIPFSKTW